MLEARHMTPAACVMVIFGASGDLTRRKIAPALYNLHRERLLPDGTVMVGFGRTDFTDDQFRGHLKGNINEFSRERPVQRDVWDTLAGRIFYHRGSYGEPRDFEALREKLERLDERSGGGGSSCTRRPPVKASPPYPAWAPTPSIHPRWW